MTSGSVMSAMTRRVPPQRGHRVMSMLKTRFNIGGQDFNGCI